MDAFLITAFQVFLIFLTVLTKVPEWTVREITVPPVCVVTSQTHMNPPGSLSGVSARRCGFQMRLYGSPVPFSNMANIWIKPEFVKAQESVQSHESPLWMYVEASGQVNLHFCFLGFLEFLQNLKLFCASQQ